jgi:hypothetical protein
VLRNTNVQTHEDAKMSAQTPADAAEQAAEQVKVAAKAYIYGYPLVYNLHEMADFVAGSPRFPVLAPYNTFGHARTPWPRGLGCGATMATKPTTGWSMWTPTTSR